MIIATGAAMFKSRLISQTTIIKWPDWFLGKYYHSLNFESCLSSKGAFKHDEEWKDLIKDIQKCMISPRFEFIYFHDCGGITKVKIYRNDVEFIEPDSWIQCDGVNHNQCYGCSDR